MKDDFAWYKAGAALMWIPIFIGTWIYCIASYGFLLGVGLGWIPAFITAWVLCWFWPVFVFGAVVVISQIV